MNQSRLNSKGLIFLKQLSFDSFFFDYRLRKKTANTTVKLNLLLLRCYRNKYKDEN